MPIGLPSQRPEPKSAWKWSPRPIERTIAPELAATGRRSTRSLVVKLGPNSGQPAIAAVTATPSIAGYSSGSAREVRRVHETVAQRLDHRLDLGDHPLAVELVQRSGDRVQPAVELEVEARGDRVGDGHLAPGVAGAAAQQHPPVRVADGLPVDGVHVVAAAHRAGLELQLEVGLGASAPEPIERTVEHDRRSIRQAARTLERDTT